MGYRSNYCISVFPANGQEEKQIQGEIEAVSGYRRTRREDITWYGWKEDIRKVARRHPGVFIEVDRNGEDDGDHELARFRGDEVESVLLRTAFPPFRSVLLPSEQNILEGHLNGIRVAVLIEVGHDGFPSPTVIAGNTPEKVLEGVLAAIREAEERDFRVVYDRGDILRAVRDGDPKASPLEMPVEGWDNVFYLHATTINPYQI